MSLTPKQVQTLVELEARPSLGEYQVGQLQAFRLFGGDEERRRVEEVLRRHEEERMRRFVPAEPDEGRQKEKNMSRESLKEASARVADEIEAELADKRSTKAPTAPAEDLAAYRKGLKTAAKFFGPDRVNVEGRR